MTPERRRCGYCGRDATSVEVPHLIDGTTFDGWEVVTIDGIEIDRCAVCAFTLDLPPAVTAYIHAPDHHRARAEHHRRRTWQRFDRYERDLELAHEARPIGEAFNDPRVPCCGRDAADCDCDESQRDAERQHGYGGGTL
jgi:hypothetical protein